MAEIGTDIALASSLLKNSALVAMPTETVYGLAGNAFDQEAILAIFKAKNRPFFDPLILHVDHVDKMSHFVEKVPSPLQKLAEAFWPGPLTLLLNRKPIVPDLITAGLPTVAVRIPAHPMALSLLATLPFPLAAPSANPFGYISPTTAAHVEAQLGDKIAYILDGGACEVGLESTIVGMENDVPVVYRLGGLSVDAIEAVIGKVKINAHSSSNPQAPGMLKSHYSPRKKFVIAPTEAFLASYSKTQIGVLTFGAFHQQYPLENQLSLSLSEHVEEAAKNLFDYLRKLDEMAVEVIIMTALLPAQGLGLAINDRLKRAAVQE
jgi:L-threonylcarbamoyladenylate synthase